MTIVSPLVFAFYALITIGFALGMFATRNIVHEGFMLLGATVGVAGLYLSMGYSFLALVQFIVYSGAVSILLVFSIMITARSSQDTTRSREFSVVGAIIALVFLAVIVSALFAYDFVPTQLVTELPSMVELGTALYSVEGWVLPFELASLVLLAALIGAIWWSRERDER